MEGGPIGARVTMCAARLVMQDWGEKYNEILTTAGLKLWTNGGYVDVTRQGTSKIKEGVRFDKEKGSLEFREEWREEDCQAGKSTLKRMSTVCQEAMNSIDPDLEFTVETQEDFEDGMPQPWTLR